VKVNGHAYRSLWTDGPRGPVHIIDQTRLPHAFETRRLDSPEAVAEAIRAMRVRGAPLIGVAGAFGLALAMERDASDASLAAHAAQLAATRPTAVNLAWALDQLTATLQPLPPEARAAAAWRAAQALADDDVAINEAIGRHGVGLFRDLHTRLKRTVNVLTHCNAGWIATVDWGTALSPIYQAHDAGLPVHVWVDETRPRNQGLLTAWELASHGVPHTLVADNAGGHLMQHGQVDLVIVGADRVTRHGDVCNKIGTYLKALAARDNGVPFYVAVPTPTFDWQVDDALAQIPIEERAGDEVRVIRGLGADGRPGSIEIAAESTRVANPAFDVTPAALVTGILTERGLYAASEPALAALRPGQA
jgi:methylthioribose-1-phosphate isomerase